MAATRKKQKAQGNDAASAHHCRDCAHCTTVTRFHTLSVKGEPTMGECPFWKQSKCVLLSQDSCPHFKEKVVI